ncbi:dethiobiotin synthase [Nigerium sp.]|uniref:dethiobiotin synthase n=1 Tax=Nigerium sp. TaxID=2042655 RepID=UPI003221AAA0
MTTDLAHGITLVTGTDTDVGKTVATAVFASHLAQRGVDVVVCKPTQTGVVGDEPGDAATVVALAGLPSNRVLEFVRLPEPLAPTTAGRRAGVPLPGVAQHAARIARLAEEHEAVLVEGAGGVRVGLDDEGRDLLDLADALAAAGTPCRFVVVARAGLGSLNHTALTCDAIRSRGHEVTRLVVGSLPDEPDLAERCNLSELPQAAGLTTLIALPSGLGSDAARLRDLARSIA